MNIFQFIFFYYLIIAQIIGFGFLFKITFLDQKEEIHIGYLGFYGLFFLTFLSYLTSFIIAHGEIFNLIVLTLGILFFIFFLKKKKILFKKDLLIFLLISVFFIFFIVGAKNHDDFPYYHFAYSHLLTQESLLKGLGNLNHGFRTHSSIFYLGSLFNFPKTDYFLIHLSPSFFMIFANIIFLDKVFKFQLEKKKELLIYSLLSFTFINIFFYRMAEHGTDRSAQIIILILILILLENFIFNFKKIDNLQLANFLIFLTFAITLKPLYSIYSIFFLIILLNYNNKIFLIKFLLKKTYVYICIFFLFFYFLINFFNTGCILYPLSFTCFENFSWSIPIKEVDAMSLWYEQWSKAGATPNFRVENPAIYIQKLNWLENWFRLYFFNKVSDYILSLLFLLSIFYIFFKNKKNLNNFKIKKNYFYLIILILIFLIEWFFKHPSLRYGGYHLFALLFFIIFINFFSVKIKFKKSKILFWVTIVLLVFVLRNTSRIYKEVNQYKLNFNNVSYAKNFQNKDIFNRINNLMNCNINKEFCNKETLYFNNRVINRKK
jgi:hypothetical protein